MAYIVDGLILGVVFVVLSFVLIGGLIASYSPGQGPSAGAVGGTLLWFLVVFVVSIAYFPFFWARGGQTPGMRPFGLRVVRDRDGGRVSGGAAVLRLIGMWISSLVFYIGFIWIFFDQRRRGWHDLIAGTVVVKDPGR